MDDYLEHTDQKDFKTFNDTFKNISKVSKNINLPTDIKNCINFILDDKNKETAENKFYKVRDIVRDFASTNNSQLDSGFNAVQEFLGFSNNAVGVAATYRLENNPKSYHL